MLGLMLGDLKYRELDQILRGDLHDFLGGLLRAAAARSAGRCRSNIRCASVERPMSGRDDGTTTMILEVQHETPLRLLRAGDGVDRRGAHGAGQRRRPELPLVPPRRQPADGACSATRTASATASITSTCWRRTTRCASWPPASSRRTPGRATSPSSRAAYPLDPDRLRPGGARFRAVPRPGPADRRGWTPLLDALRPRPGTPLGELVAATSAATSTTHFEYARDVTLASSPIDDVLEQRQGRLPGLHAPDDRHAALASACRPATSAATSTGPNKESQSHAWCEVWLPDLGWVGIDPTNDCSVDEHFIKVAVGRDFTDVPPNKGVYRGRGRGVDLRPRRDARAGRAAVAVLAGATAAAERAADGHRRPAPRPDGERGRRSQQQQQ